MVGRYRVRCSSAGSSELKDPNIDLCEKCAASLRDVQETDPLVIVMAGLVFDSNTLCVAMIAALD